MGNTGWVGPSQEPITKQFWGCSLLFSFCPQGKGRGYPVSCLLSASPQVLFIFFNEIKSCLHPTALSHEGPRRQPVYLGSFISLLALPNFLFTKDTSSLQHAQLKLQSFLLFKIRRQTISLPSGKGEGARPQSWTWYKCPSSPQNRCRESVARLFHNEIK